MRFAGWFIPLFKPARLDYSMKDLSEDYLFGLFYGGEATIKDATRRNFGEGLRYFMGVFEGDTYENSALRCARPAGTEDLD